MVNVILDEDLLPYNFTLIVWFAVGVRKSLNFNTDDRAVLILYSILESKKALHLHKWGIYQLMVLSPFAKCVNLCLPGKIAALFTLLWKGEKKKKKQDGDLRGQKMNPWLVVLIVTSKKQQACLCLVLQRADFFFFFSTCPFKKWSNLISRLGPNN